ncbi:MAG: response regulator [Pyrinomonadaceae bacterium]
MTTLPSVPKDARDALPVDGKASNFLKPLVLVVEDHEDTRFMLRYLMEARGCRVAEATDGEQAVHLAANLHPDLILMDTSLPLLSGLNATSRIRELATLNDVPIVFLSGHAQPESRAAALAKGGDEYLVKPLKLGDLDRVVERHLGKSASRAVS